MGLGLNNQARTTLGEFETVRRRLYAMFVICIALILCFSIIVAIFYSLEATEARLPGWFSATMGLVLPGLPTRILDFAERHPVAVLIVGIVLYLLRKASQKAKDAAQEYAFQAWRRTTNAGRSGTIGPMPPIHPPRWVPSLMLSVGFLVVITVFVGVNTICPQQLGPRANDIGESSCSNGARGDCWLALGETVLVNVNARKPRNETGVLLKKNARYSARFVASTEWRDGDKIRPKPRGFEFDCDLFGFTKFWWMRWLRPHPDGRWFEVVGRVDRDPNVFSILDAIDACRPYKFTAPMDGELVLHVNDVRYENNGGVMTIELQRCGVAGAAGERGESTTGKGKVKLGGWPTGG